MDTQANNKTVKIQDQLEKKIVFFDDKCVLCNNSCQFILNNDKSNSIYVAALQSDLGQYILQSNGKDPEQLNTMLYWDTSKLHSKSTASISIARDMKNWISIVYVFIIIPSFIRNAVYNIISRNRIKWFGKSEQCMISHPRLLKD